MKIPYDNDIAATLALGEFLEQKPKEVSEFLGQQFVRKLIRVITKAGVPAPKIAICVGELLECIAEHCEEIDLYDGDELTPGDTE